MSKQGIRKVAKIFEDMQQLRIELLKNNTDKQDLLLAHMLEEGKETMKDILCSITGE